MTGDHQFIVTKIGFLIVNDQIITASVSVSPFDNRLEASFFSVNW